MEPGAVPGVAPLTSTKNIYHCHIISTTCDSLLWLVSPKWALWGRSVTGAVAALPSSGFGGTFAVCKGGSAAIPTRWNRALSGRGLVLRKASTRRPKGVMGPAPGL